MMSRRMREDYEADLAMTEEQHEELGNRHLPLEAGVEAALQGAMAQLPEREHRAFVNGLVRTLGEAYEDGKFDIGGGEHPPWRRDGEPPFEIRTWEAVRAAAKPELLDSGVYRWLSRPSWHGVCPPRGEIPRPLACPGKPWAPVPGEQPEVFASEAEAFAFLDKAIIEA